MSEFGDYLRKVRRDKGLSQADVFQQTGITNSRLSKVENGADGTLNASEIKKLVALYEIALIPVLIKAGYLDTADLEEYCSGFKNTSLLDSEDKAHIQNEIDFILNIKRKDKE